MLVTEDHSGHRKRLRESYIKEGREFFPEEKLLELVLGYAVPRRDVLPVAKKLISRFGSLEGVFNASVSSLSEVDGVNQYSAVLLSAFARYRGCMLKKPEEPQKLDSLNSIAEFVLPLFGENKDECVYGVFLDKDYNIIRYGKLFDGGFDSVKFKFSFVTKNAIFLESPHCIIAHNHPGRSSSPSQLDIDSTLRLKASLASNDIIMDEHIIIGSQDWTPALKYMGERNKENNGTNSGVL